MSKLNIYKASAGSGKTFSLTLAYFRLIFRAPHEYKNILAVTFTNKATEEMKSRIIKELHKLAEGESGSYGAILKEELGMDDLTLKNRAYDLRSIILHDYGHLAITTIDRFFQRIVKSFTKELGIFPGYNVELDSEYVLSRSVDKLMETVKTNTVLRNWIAELMDSNVEDEKSWSIKGKIAELGGELFKENYMLLDNDTLLTFNNKEFLKTYKSFLNKVTGAYESRLTDIASQAILLIEKSGLEINNFKNGKRGCVNHFYKLREGKFDDVTPTTYGAIDNPDAWVTKSADACVKQQIEAVYPKLNLLLKEAVDLYDTKYHHYLSAVMIEKNLYQLGILHDVYREVRAYCEENEIMLLSDTTYILNLLISGNDSSFLFEKTGNYYKHIMIDEFQDTSSMQWQNFRPLLTNTLSENNCAMIVGDVKQSIYRWRNGDWSLLAHKVEEEFRHFGSEVTALESNWRSNRHIVDFNNFFFSEAVKRLKELYDSEAGEQNPWSEAILKAYQRPEQEARILDSGYVDIVFGPDKKEEKSAEAIMESTVSAINDIVSRSGEQKNIVILVRDSKEGAFVVDYLITYNANTNRPIRFISNDSLYVNASFYVKFIVAILKYIAEPYDTVNRATILFLYNVIIQKKRDDLECIFAPMEEEAFFNSFHFNNVTSFSLFETVEMIVAKFGLKTGDKEIAYLIAFQDIIYEYENKNSNNILLFLEWWKKEERKRVLTTSEDIDAIKILTIHKSKGLEFDYVLLPFCNWELDTVKPARRIWCDTGETEFNALPHIPLNYSSKLAETIFKECYYTEHLKAYVDNLNLLYVAQTRAKKELYLRPYAPATDKNGEIKKEIASFIYNILESAGRDGRLPFSAENRRLQYGEKECNGKIDKHYIENETIVLSEYPVNRRNDKITEKYSYKEYNDPDVLVRAAIDEGKLLHEIFKSIKYADDVERAVQQVYQIGLISMERREEYVSKVNGYLDNPQVIDWFDRKYQILNERDILLTTGERVRPDRVLVKDGEAFVIDYKFGNQEDNKYVRQLQFYARSLQKMGYKKVEGCIWYANLNKFIKI